VDAPAVLEASVSALRALPHRERRCVVARLADVYLVPDPYIASMFERSQVWVRVMRFRALRERPCVEHTERSCGRRRDCAHARGREVLKRVKRAVERQMVEVEYA
jgi:hypothetical protein